VSRPPDISPLSQLLRRIDALADGAPPVDTVPTGFPTVDRVLGGGLRAGDLVVLGGDVGSGKSALALGIAIRSAVRGSIVRYYSAEMTADRIHERILAIEGRARIDDLRRGTLDDITRAAVAAATLRLRDVPPMIEAIPSDLREAVQAVPGLQLGIIDSLQALPDSENGIRAIKAMALAHNIVLLVTSHLPGLDKSRPDPRPTLDDFGPAHAVKQHADVVLGLFREEMYGGGQAVEGATELLVLKNRGGPTGYVDLYFYKQWLRFEDMLDPPGGL
jgi:replicative DNA helicase